MAENEVTRLRAEIAHLHEVEQQRASRNAIIARIGQLMTSRLGSQDILSDAVRAIHDELNYPSVAVLLIDDADPEMLVRRAACGIVAEQVPDPYRQSIHTGLIGAAVRTQQVVRVNNVQSDTRYLAIPADAGIYSECAVPIATNDSVLGVLDLQSRAVFNDEDMRDAATMAGQLAVAIENTRLFKAEQQRSARLALIARTGQRIATRLDPEDLFDTLVQELQQKLGYDHAALFVRDANEPDILVQRACATRWPNSVALGYRQSIHRGVVGAAARHGLPQRINDVRSAAHYVSMTNNPSDEEPHAELATPILLGERLLGVLDLASDREFHNEDEQAAQIIADQLAVAIDNAELFSATQRSLDETQLLYRTSQRMSVAMSVDDVVKAYLEQVAVRKKYACSITLYELDGEGERKTIEMMGRWSPSEGLTFPTFRLDYLRDALDPPLDAGETVMIHDVHTDPRVPPRLREIQMRNGWPSLCMIPLMIYGERIGLVILSAPEPHHWSESDLQPYRATAAQLSTAIDARRQQNLLYQRGQQVAILEERHRLARELHDSVTQLIFSTTLIAQSISPAFKRSPAEGEKRVTRLLELSQTALAEMRALLFELRSPISDQAGTTPTRVMPIQQSIVPGLMRLQRDGLAAAIQRYASDVQRDGLHIEIDAQHYPLTSPTLRPHMACEEALYRIAQEALNNVVKHAAAQRVTIRLTVQDQVAHLVVADNGKGMASVDEAAAGRGIGLKTMRERVEALRGTLTATSALGRGTTIQVMIPI